MGIGRREGEVERKGFERRKENRVRGIRGFLVCKNLHVTQGDVQKCILLENEVKEGREKSTQDINC